MLLLKIGDQVATGHLSMMNRIVIIERSAGFGIE
jgi:hypothetical protein